MLAEAMVLGLDAVYAAMSKSPKRHIKVFPTVPVPAHLERKVLESIARQIELSVDGVTCKVEEGE